jgi:acyl-CoA thioesterase-2
MNDVPAVLQAKQVDGGRWSAPHPESDPEGRDIVFSGQILAQMMMISSAAGGGKAIKSIHAIFARAGVYSAGPIDYRFESMHAGRAWASDTLTALQGDKLLSRGLVLLSSDEPDLMRHSPRMPRVPDPDKCAPKPMGVIYPGAEVRAVEPTAGEPSLCLWVRGPAATSAAASQAIVAWSQPGLAIGAAMQAHRDTVSIKDAHRTISTGVISHTAHFHEPADAGDWLLYVHEAPYAGRGRVLGQGAVFTRGGALVSTFAQDSMARKVEGQLDWKKAM